MASQGAAGRARARIEGFWDGRDAPPVTPPIEALGGEDGIDVCALALRAVWPSFGAIDHRAWLAAQRALASSTADHARVEIGAAWSLLAAGEHEAAADGFARGGARCRQLAIVDGYLEAGAGAVLAMLELGRTDEALVRARQLARSARSEGIAHLEVLAYVALARARRMAGSIELAMHALRAVAPLAPTPWQRWIAWEQELAGSRADPPGEVAVCLAAIDAADGASGRSAGRAALDALRRAAGGVRALETDAIDLACALDLDATEATAPMMAFASGASAAIPRGFHAIGAGAHEDLAYVAAGPALAPRRVLARALGSIGLPALVPERPPQLRTRSLLARLAWIAPEAADEEALFRELYGFAYDRVRHKPIFDTLVHRARAKAAPHAALERGGGRMRLSFERPTLVWDPACHRSAEDRVLAYLASHGSSGARDVATALGQPLRTVQALLRGLTESEGCLAQREGRNVVYAIEDTCLSELTRQRFLALTAEQAKP